MKILLSPDKFRGSMTAAEACEAMNAGIKRDWPETEVVSVPLADGGEGTLDVLLHANGGTKRRAFCHNPLGQPINAGFGLSGDGKTAFVELASASGLHHLAAHERDALRTSTFGTGQLVRAALEAGATRIILGVGGSASTDGGTGMAAALGYRFFDESERELRPCLKAHLRSGIDLVMELTRFDEQLNGVELVITGEGKLDAQTLQGKLIGGICQRAGVRGIPVVALCGTLDADPEALRALGLAYAASILTRPMRLDEALAEGPSLLRDAAFFVVNLFRSRQSSVNSR